MVSRPGNGLQQRRAPREVQPEVTRAQPQLGPMGRKMMIPLGIVAWDWTMSRAKQAVVRVLYSVTGARRLSPPPDAMTTRAHRMSVLLLSRMASAARPVA